ncbi:MAG: WecB/TagA/CpsF family glycosyltransferase [Eubacteriales bacterium]|jgi:N-acetylglucosaminyldiphosphoundecaprenol N-acetyl-beta-D-mannosaminyltransferase
MKDVSDNMNEKSAMKTGRIDVLGVGFDSVTLDEAADRVMEHVTGEGMAGGVFTVHTPNSEIVEACINDKSGELYKIINSGSLIVPDGIGVVKAAAMLGTPVKEKVAGVELGEEILHRSAKAKVPVCFLGGKPGIAELAAEKMKAKYPGLVICGTADGYFKKSGEESDAIIAKIKASGAAILYVCLGAPTQERWIYENREALAAAGVRAALGLGGSLDIYSGAARRAPRIFIKLGIEWLYRLLREPSRAGRMMALPRLYMRVRREAARMRAK